MYLPGVENIHSTPLFYVFPFGESHFPAVNCVFPVDERHFPAVNCVFPVDESHSPAVNCVFPIDERHFPAVNCVFPVDERYSPAVNCVFPVGESHFPAVNCVIPVGESHSIFQFELFSLKNRQTILVKWIIFFTFDAGNLIIVKMPCMASLSKQKTKPNYRIKTKNVQTRCFASLLKILIK